MKLKPCPFCGGEAEVSAFVYKIKELPKPIKLFGKWSLIKMRYREIPTRYIVDCKKFCNGFANSSLIAMGTTEEEAIEQWNRSVENAAN